jgi:hypothetical protein
VEEPDADASINKENSSKRGPEASVLVGGSDDSG